MRRTFKPTESSFMPSSKKRIIGGDQVDYIQSIFWNLNINDQREGDQNIQQNCVKQQQKKIQNTLNQKQQKQSLRNKQQTMQNQKQAQNLRNEKEHLFAHKPGYIPKSLYNPPPNLSFGFTIKNESIEKNLKEKVFIIGRNDQNKQPIKLPSDYVKTSILQNDLKQQQQFVSSKVQFSENPFKVLNTKEQKIYYDQDKNQIQTNQRQNKNDNFNFNKEQPKQEENSVKLIQKNHLSGERMNVYQIQNAKLQIPIQQNNEQNKFLNQKQTFNPFNLHTNQRAEKRQQ